MVEEMADLFGTAETFVFQSMLNHDRTPGYIITTPDEEFGTLAQETASIANTPAPEGANLAVTVSLNNGSRVAMARRKGERPGWPEAWLAIPLKSGEEPPESAEDSDWGHTASRRDDPNDTRWAQLAVELAGEKSAVT